MDLLSLVIACKYSILFQYGCILNWVSCLYKPLYDNMNMQFHVFKPGEL